MTAAWQVAILARAPVPGAAKTRLIPRLGEAGAAALQRQLIERALQRAAASGAEVVLWLAGMADAALVAATQRAGASMREQPAGDLGARMRAALAHAHANGRVAVVIGTDCPAQRPDDLLQARALLGQHDVVLQPAWDGGYVLIALARPQPALFEDVQWGSDAVLATTRARIEALGLSSVELRGLPDLDRPADLDLAVARGWVDAPPCA
jgi:rSAM/selenodomain-associated transferase 1